MTIGLRPWHEDDADAVTEACNDPAVVRYLPFLPHPYTRQDALDFIGRASHLHLAITEAGAGTKAGAGIKAETGNGRLLGAIGCTPRGTDTGEVGYWIAPWGRRQGAATAALRQFAQRLFDDGMRRVYLETALSNIASQRVAVAGGFTREGIARGSSFTRDGSRQDMVVWSRLPDDPPGPSPRALPDLPGGLLTDGVVTLRPLTGRDGPDTYELRALPEVSGRSVVQTPLDPAVVMDRCAEAMAKWIAGQRAEMTIRDATDDSYLGEIALFYAEPLLLEAMIGYSLIPRARGRGIAARAARLITGWGFDIGMARMIAGTAPDNIASQRVLEAAGYVREGFQLGRLPGPDGTRIDNVQYAKLRPAAT